MMNREQAEQNIKKLDAETLGAYAIIAYFLENQPDDYVTRGLKRALIRRIEKGTNIEQEIMGE